MKKALFILSLTAISVLCLLFILDNSERSKNTSSDITLEYISKKHENKIPQELATRLHERQ